MRISTFFSTVALLLGWVSSVLAASVVPWVGGTARFGTYAMDVVNEDIRALDALIEPEFDEIENGFGFGADLGVTLSSSVDLALHYERLLASSDVSDSSGSLELDYAANAFYLGLEWKQLTSAGPAFGLGGGAGIVSTAGELNLTITGLGSASGEIEGSGPLFQAYALVDFTPRSRVSALALAGYRHARASSVKLDDEPLFGESDYDVDYSGLIVSASFRIRFNSPSSS
jgi:hypothetical protein